MKRTRQWRLCRSVWKMYFVVYLPCYCRFIKLRRPKDLCRCIIQILLEVRQKFHWSSIWSVFTARNGISNELLKQNIPILYCFILHSILQDIKHKHHLYIPLHFVYADTASKLRKKQESSPSVAADSPRADGVEKKPDRIEEKKSAKGSV